MVLLVGIGSLVNPQAVGSFCFFLVLLGCLVYGYSGAVWFSYFIFLSFLGGLLVVFLYAVALAPSPYFESFSERMMTPLKVVGLMTICFCLFLIWEGWWCYMDVLCSGLFEVPMFHDPEMTDSGWVSSVSFLFLAVLLAVCMISITKLCSYNSQGSLRGVRSTMS
uniref:NADH dehydrogenase subunit 6 n=1 Tax=Amusium pleuronectes TaxID=158443 RepID=A0A7U0IY71_9BIVA|nr:NADH dehydrogenase subunit 6 [Amusium pleuronectes]QQV73587.1 NADH dehydrogenase subunit 6 [Amusium pleuronectes]